MNNTKLAETIKSALGDLYSAREDRPQAMKIRRAITKLESLVEDSEWEENETR